MREHLARLFEYDDWANRTELEHLVRLESVPDRATAIFAHIIGTEWLWYARLHGERSEMAVWPALTLDECGAHLDHLHQTWHSFIDTTPLDNTIAYKNTKGEDWTSVVSDVLTQVVLHGTYHRGQIAIVLRDGGDAPAYTDYIECTRRGFI